jgi:hypothetical protein
MIACEVAFLKLSDAVSIAYIFYYCVIAYNFYCVHCLQCLLLCPLLTNFITVSIAYNFYYCPLLTIFAVSIAYNFYCVHRLPFFTVSIAYNFFLPCPLLTIFAPHSPKGMRTNML